VNDITSYIYDPVTGDLLSITQPHVGRTHFSGYDQNRNVGTVTDPNGVATSYTYDERNRVKTVTNQANGSTTQYFYDPLGNLDYLVLPERTTIDYTYDAAGRLIRVEDDLENAIIYTYDSESNKTREEIQDPDGTLKKHLDFQYDENNLLEKIINPDETFTQFGYDGNGNRTSMKDSRGNTTTYRYDKFNRLRWLTQPGGIRTTYTYDAHDNLVVIEDANFNQTLYTYDDFGRLVEIISPDTGTTTYRYDEAGNLIQKTDANGITVSYGYDALNRLTTVRFPDISQGITYSYDSLSVSFGKGRLTGMVDQTGPYAYHYDPRGNLIKEEKVINGITYTIEYRYDKNATLQSITYPSGRMVTYDLDDVGRVSHMTTTINGQSKTVASNLNYLPYGGITGLAHGNGLSHEQGYDLQYRISSIQAESVLNFRYGHDENGNITSITDELDSARSQIFGYDDLDRLSSASGIYRQISYRCDFAGNRESVTTNGVNEYYTYTYGTNRLVNIRGRKVKGFGYDNNGNVTSEDARSYVYNQNNRLIRAIENGLTLGEYTYNGVGQRIKKVIDGATTIYHYDWFGNLIAESDGKGAFRVDYVYLNRQPLAQIHISSTESIFYYHNDHLGTPQVLTDDNGQVVWKAYYKPFGKVDIVIEKVKNNFRFPGQYYDEETGLHYNYIRYYKPEIGRFLRADPIGPLGLTSSEPYESINHLYVYSQNQPINRLDAYGLFSKDCCDCPGAEWSLFSVPAVSLFYGGGGTIGRTTFKCKSDKNKVCKGTTICFGGGAIATVGIGIDLGGMPGETIGVTDACYKQQLQAFTSGVFATGGPFSILWTGMVKSIGIGKTWLVGGIAYTTCFTTSLQCNF
jgi:RHS repeat-associated protein